MRILAIRGRNLASLAGDFEVDFTAEPLASAGVFAITGPTGAGKSTLLDALSLALFHDTPRLSGAAEARVQLPDAEDYTISPRDVRNILRRGTSEGYAEVDYIGLDGERWRARWEVRRAHGKASGRLQNATAQLENLSREEQHGSKITETRAKILQTLGLSYEQFCRSVLLAQNEFAAFLRASGTERSELLEALTGTEIYKTISMLCHERTAEEKRKLATLEAELETDPPLGEQDRQALENTIEEASAEEVRLEQAREALGQEADWHEQGHSLQQRQQALEDGVKTCQKKLDARQEDQTMVKRMEALDEARPMYQTLQQAQTALRRHQEELPTLQLDLESAEADQHDRKESVTHSSEQLKEAEGQLKTQQPNIRQARVLDQQITTIRQRLDDCAAQTDQLSTQLAEASARCQAAQTNVDENLASIQIWESWQAEHPVFKPILEQWAEAGKQLESVVNAEQQVTAAHEEVARNETQAKKANTALHTSETRLESARQALQRARTALESAEQEEQDFDADAMEKEASAISTQRQQLQTLEYRIDEETSAADHAKRSQKAHTDLVTEHSNRAERLQELAEAIPAASERHAQADKAFQTSRNIADQYTAALRRDLVEGEACPVCGSTEHPGHAGDDSKMAELVDTLARQLEKAEKSLHSLEKEQSALKAEHTQAQRQLNALASELKQGNEKLTAATKAREQAARDAGFDDLPSSELAAAMARQRDELDMAEKSLKQKRQALDKARQQLQLARQARTRAEQAQENAEKALDSDRKTAAPQINAHQAARQQLESHHEHLAKALSEVQKQLRMDKTPEPTDAGMLSQQWQRGNTLRHAARLADDLAPLLQITLQDSLEALEGLKQQQQGLATKVEATEREYQSQQKERNRCLADTDPDALEKKLNEAIDQARANLEKANQALQDARTQLASAKTTLDRWKQENETRQDEEDSARSSLTQWLAAHHADEHIQLEASDLETLLDWLAVPADNWRPAQTELQRLHQSLHEQQILLAECKRQLDSWKKKARSTRPAADVNEALEQISKQWRSAVENTANRKAELRTDDQRRERAAGQLRAITSQQTVAEQWMKLDELIGSANGSRFRDYAQQFTLDVLIAHANTQLATLSPRYRLQRGDRQLNILVVDDDMGGEIRGVHSLSGGETFLASLALALGLAELSSQRIPLESLFIDEGFGSLDADTLRVAMDALDRLQAQGRKVGVISHVQDMSDRIGTQIRVERTGPGRSDISIQG